MPLEGFTPTYKGGMPTGLLPGCFARDIEPMAVLVVDFRVSANATRSSTYTHKSSRRCCYCSWRLESLSHNASCVIKTKPYADACLCFRRRLSYKLAVMRRGTYYFTIYLSTFNIPSVTRCRVNTTVFTTDVCPRSVLHGACCRAVLSAGSKY